MPSSSPPLDRPIRALLVGARPVQARRLGGLLAKAGPDSVELATIDRLNDALPRMTDDDCDVVLLDRHLPDGLGALEQIGELAPDMPVVVLSGPGDETETWQIVDYGAEEFVLRGDRGEQLLSTVRQAIARKQIERQLTRMALRDPLTGLANRLLLRERLERASLRAHREQLGFGVLFLDLDGFKHVNDSLGHELGDQLLRAVARRLESLVRRVDTLARLGGDEFVLLVEGLSRPADAALVAQKALGALAQPFEIRGHELHIGASIGIGLYPADTSDPEALIELADQAMYRAKHGDPERYRFHGDRPEESDELLQPPPLASPSERHLD